jgi:hypothetical protein
MKLTAISLGVAISLLAGCSTTNPFAEKKAVETTIPSPTPAVKEAQTLAAPGKIEAPLTIDVPPWYIKAPASTDDYVYVTGTAVSSDLSMSRAKAMLDAQQQLAAKINGVIDSTMRQSRKDSAGTVATDYTSLMIRKNIIETSIAGHHLEDSRVQAENRGYRTFVLVRYPVGDANRFLKKSVAKMDQDKEIDKELSRSQATPQATPPAVSQSSPAVVVTPVPASAVESKAVPVSELKLMEVDNEEYKKRRAEALQKPGAVIGNVTLR